MPRRKNNPDSPTYFTTFQVARMLGVSPPTVVNWVNSGLLVAHRTPGGHRRITEADIGAFARANDYPLASSAETNAAGARRVLVVDDEPDFAEVLRSFLTIKSRFDVEVALSGFAAGVAVARFRPAVILMDILMPEMDGFEVLRTLREDPQTRSIPVVACTGYRDPNVESRVRQEGFDGYIEKPVRLDELAATLERVVRDGRRAPAEAAR